MFIASAVPFRGWFQRSTARAGGDNSRFISSLVAACEELCSENQRQVWAGNVMLCCTRLCTWRVVSTCERSERRWQIRRSHTAPGHRLQLPDDEKLIPPSPQLLLSDSICKGGERDGVKVRLSSFFFWSLIYTFRTSFRTTDSVFLNFNNALIELKTFNVKFPVSCKSTFLFIIPFMFPTSGTLVNIWSLIPIFFSPVAYLHFQVSLQNKWLSNHLFSKSSELKTFHVAFPVSCKSSSSFVIPFTMFCNWGYNIWSFSTN